MPLASQTLDRYHCKRRYVLILLCVYVRFIIYYTSVVYIRYYDHVHTIYDRASRAYRRRRWLARRPSAALARGRAVLYDVQAAKDGDHVVVERIPGPANHGLALSSDTLLPFNPWL